MGRGEVREEASSAERASGVREEPRVNALDVEGMAAVGEEPEFVFGVKFTEADGAVEWILEADNGSVEEDWQGVDEGLVDASVVEVEELLELALEGGGIVGFLWFSCGCSEEESDEEVDDSRDEEDDG